MIERRTRWSVADWSNEQEGLALTLSKQLNLSLLVTRLLVKRGYSEQESASRFLSCTVEQLHDPFLLKGMEQAVNRLKKAIENNEKIRIYGDYDADGVTSTSLLIRLFASLNCRFDYYIPHREKEGYGLNRGAIEQAVQDGIDLMVTVDTGISAADEIDYANQLSLDVIITDHHEPPAVIPAACAVVNPKQEDCPYPFKGLAGVGVAFKLACALLGTIPREWTDLVSIGTIADLMPLTDENRVMVQMGLKQINDSAAIGIQALAKVSGLDIHVLTSTNIAFGLAPRLNAAGRLEHAGQAVELLISNRMEAALELAERLDALNKERQAIVEEIVEQAEEQWQAKLADCRRGSSDQLNAQQEPGVIVLAGEGWNVGVIGIVASKLLEKYYKPVIILGIDRATGMCKGSARSIEGFDLHAALTSCEEWLDHYGGHQAAAGMSMRREHVASFAEAMSVLAYERLTEEDWIPKSAIDLACTLEEASLSTIEQLAMLEPFGAGNPSPKLMFNNIVVKDRRAIGKDAKHLKLQFGAGQQVLDAIGFGVGHHAALLKAGHAVDVIGELSVNEWNGRRTPQLQISDIHMGSQALMKFPEREQFIRVYQELRVLQAIDEAGAAASLGKRCGISHEAAQLVLDVFVELEFIERQGGRLTAVAAPARRDLSTSSLYQRVKRETELLNRKTADI
ncbi:single-stranded-DNA-specific exonuclease RecJ [Paenibacillus sp. IITD108]|uniref:single-stranded-DNA-specific exonuclease RecJ n=1 Tax=Paenibacillus sp. IITD108 TaxID=3116649 RepID=UPI002F3F6BB4